MESGVGMTVRKLTRNDVKISFSEMDVDANILFPYSLLDYLGWSRDEKVLIFIIDLERRTWLIRKDFVLGKKLSPNNLNSCSEFKKFGFFPSGISNYGKELWPLIYTGDGNKDIYLCLPEVNIEDIKNGI